MSDLQCFHGLPAATCQDDMCQAANARVDRLERKIARYENVLEGIAACGSIQWCEEHMQNDHFVSLDHKDEMALAEAVLEAHRVLGHDGLVYAHSILCPAYLSPSMEDEGVKPGVCNCHKAKDVRCDECENRPCICHLMKD